MEVKSPVWICDCGKQTDQGMNDVIKTKCECGKPLTKLKSPDGVIQEFIEAPEWFVKEFTDQDNAIFGLTNDFGRMNAQRIVMERKIGEQYDKMTNARNKMKNIVEQGAKRLKLTKRQEMSWNYQHNIQRFVGSPKPPKPPEVKR